MQRQMQVLRAGDTLQHSRVAALPEDAIWKCFLCVLEMLLVCAGSCELHALSRAALLPSAWKHIAYGLTHTTTLLHCIFWTA